MVNVSFVNNDVSFDLSEYENNPNFSTLIQEYDINIHSFLKDWFDDSQKIEVQTSGSTGTPKTISLSKDKMKQSARNTISYFKLNENDTILQCLPSGFIAGKMIWVRALVGKLNVMIAPIKSNPLKELNQKIDFVAMTPLQVTTALNDTPEKFNFIKKLIIGGAPVSEELKERLQNISTICWATYGMTETITHIAVQQLNGKEKSNYFEALSGVTFKLGESHNLIIDVPFISENEIITEDIVNLQDHTHFEWLGRKDFVINSGGVKLFPEQIEKKLSGNITNRFFIHKMPHTKFGEVPILIVEGKSNTTLEELKPLLNKFELPHKIAFVPNFSETESGKVNRIKTFEGVNF